MINAYCSNKLSFLSVLVLESTANHTRHSWPLSSVHIVSVKGPAETDLNRKTCSNSSTIISSDIGVSVTGLRR